VHYIRKYHGNYRFTVLGGELFATDWPDRSFNFFTYDHQEFNPQAIWFRDDIAETAFYRIHDEEPVGELEEFITDSNEWALRQPYFGAHISWADTPFAGLTIGDNTTELLITVNWDLDNVIELWDFGADGLHFQLAADFIDRFSVSVQQVTD
jgi:hypothetical protein